jgi:DNA-binding PadR family transcriptional regulator
MVGEKEIVSSSDWAVLALVTEKPTHGWAIATQLARGGEIGSIWSLGRPIVYQGLERLSQEGLIEIAGLERGARGPHRVIYKATPKGRREVSEWLARPIERVREIRSLFLLKVVLSQRAGINIEPLLVAQRAMIVPFVSWLEAQLDEADPKVPAETTALYFRLETAQTIVRFIDGMLDAPAGKRATEGLSTPAEGR